MGRPLLTQGERDLHDRFGLVLGIEPRQAGLGDDHAGVVIMAPRDATAGYATVLCAKAWEETTLGQLNAFAVWVVRVVERYIDHGPEPDGWQLRSDGDYQLHCAIRPTEGLAELVAEINALDDSTD